jgi:hypothetical protein
MYVKQKWLEAVRERKEDRPPNLLFLFNFIAFKYF